ncbi:AAA family ATPase [Bradyrhizobium diazoefficiens]
MLEEIALSWFRGASTKISLETQNKSIVIHGPNGSGKSSFVDGIEYLLSQGKLQHLAHTYSGRRQELGIINTGATPDADRHVELRFKGASIKGTIAPNGACSISNREIIENWNSRRIILRQDEVSEFIKASAGDKYSVLLPLLGLDPLENVAVNLRALGRKISEIANYDRVKGRLSQLELDWRAKFGSDDWEIVKEKLKTVYRAHMPNGSEPTSLKALVNELRPVLDSVVSGLQSEHAAHLAIKTAADQPLKKHLSEVQRLAVEALKLSEPLIETRLSILESTHVYAEQLNADGNVVCPACGQSVLASDLKAHVASEKLRLEAAIAIFGERNASLNLLADSIAIVQSCLSRPELEGWLGAITAEQIKEHVSQFRALQIEALREGKLDASSTAFTKSIHCIADELAKAANHVPPSIEKLVADLGMLDAASHFPEIVRLRSRIEQIDVLTNFIKSMENETREEIKAQTKSIVKDISDDIQGMWAVLHPAEPIDGVHLYQPEGSDKALDIALRFYGREQLSPRLTLSEGHRNSLGLCVFLALAKRDSNGGPLVLDDVVSSFDREHRSYVTDLLSQEFSDRQVLIFTHDYDWFVELRTRLAAKLWHFKILLPWKEPAIGIRWANNAGGFDLARELLESDPASAAAKARAVMDTQLAAIAEVLGILVPFIKGPRNDLRFAGDLLERLSKDCERKMRRKNGGEYTVWDVPTQKAKAAQGLLLPFANAGTHGRYVSKGEADRLIDACEAAIDSLTCEACKHPVWNAAVREHHLRCDCDAIRWRL